MSIFIISEIGINHNGDVELAKKLITESKNCGPCGEIPKKLVLFTQKSF